MSDITNQIVKGSQKAGKKYTFDDTHDQQQPAAFWFQESHEGRVLFIVFYSQACRWSRCLGCNLPTRMASRHVGFKAIMAQIDNIFTTPQVIEQKETIKKVIVSNNGSILDQETFSSTALMYLLAQLNINFPQLAVLTLETRAEYVEFAELEFIARALAEGDTHTQLEIAIGFEAFDDHIRNQIFDKGLSLKAFEQFVAEAAPFGYAIKTYFMQKPIPGLSDDDATVDIQRAIDYLSDISRRYNIQVNMHLNPTYVAKGTILEQHFLKGDYMPPTLQDVVKAVLHAEGKPISIFVGLSDEGLAVEGGSFIREEGQIWIDKLHRFNKTQNFELLKDKK